MTLWCLRHCFLGYIPGASFEKRIYYTPDYQTPIERPNLYLTVQNSPQTRFPQGFQPRVRSNQNRYPYNPDNQIILRISQLTIGTVSGLTQPTIEFPTEYQENTRESGQQNFPKQIASNENRNQKSENLKYRVRDNPITEDTTQNRKNRAKTSNEDSDKMSENKINSNGTIGNSVSSRINSGRKGIKNSNGKELKQKFGGKMNLK